MMTTHLKETSPQSTLEHVTARILASGRVTQADTNYLLRVMASEKTLSATEHYQVKRIFERLQMGLVRVVNER